MDKKINETITCVKCGTPTNFAKAGLITKIFTEKGAILQADCPICKQTYFEKASKDIELK